MAKRKRKKPLDPRPRDASRSRTQYFRDVGTHPLMDKAAEIELASRIETHELDAWQSALSYPPMLCWVKHIVNGTLENPPQFARVESAAAEFRATRRKAEQNKLETAAMRLAKRILDRDRDHLALDELVSRLGALANDPASDDAHDLIRFSTKSRVFRRHLCSIQESAACAAAGRHQFVQCNLRLAVHVANRYTGYGVPFDDLIQEGNLGLMKAVDRFDYRRGNRFSTYAMWWIHHTIGRAVAEFGRTVRVPVHVRDTHQRAIKITKQLSRSLGRPPTDSEVAAELGISLTKLRTAKENLRATNVSLDEPVGEGDKSSRLEVFEIPYEDAASAVDAVISKSIASNLYQRLGALTAKEADIVRRRFGLEGHSPQTLKQIADRYGLSRERVRQLESKALEKLRKTFDENGERGWG